MAAHPEIQAEQSHIDRAYARLDAMRARVLAMRDSALAQSGGGTHQAREERDVMVRSSLARLQQLQIGDEPLCFGRLDRVSGERFYIGRLAVSDEDQEPLVVDWRAPVAEPFYRATGRHPMGLTRRRHFLTQGRRVRAIEDEVFDLDAVAADDSSLTGEAALLATLEETRSGAMRDIVATIQAEQDEIIRSPLAGVLVVQGGPGTGKTAVALHRAAYLLYTHRFPLERQGVLVVGPNPVFLRYIEQVLPSLGETGVTLTTVSGLVAGVEVKGRDTPLAARVKGDRRMARIVARAVADRQRALPRDVVVPFGAYRLRLTVAASAEIVASARRRPGPHNGRRRHVESLVLGRLHAQLTAGRDRARRAGLEPGAPEGDDRAAFEQEVRQVPELRAALDRMWPVLTPEELLHDLFGARVLIDLAAGRRLSEDEKAALHRSRSTTLEDIPWTDGDVPLLDEAAVLLGHRRRGAEANEVVRTYGHIVVDEAQDLSPMQLRMLTRRSLSGSMTVVGDVAQAVGPWSPASWNDVLAHLPRRRPSRVVELTVNYRTPVEIMDLASRVLAASAPHLLPPRSVRSTGVPPAVRRASPGHLVAEAAGAARALQGEIGGTVAVIAPAALAGALDRALGGPGIDALGAPLAAFGVGASKGLEFDGVVVVEPAGLVEEAGLRGLYVALTRTTKRLIVVHERALPAPLALTAGAGDGEGARAAGDGEGARAGGDGAPPPTDPAARAAG